MKSMKRRLLSLFMAMVMVCSLVPGALAADDNIQWTEGTSWANEPNDLPENHQHSICGQPTITAPTCTQDGSRVYTCNTSYTPKADGNSPTAREDKTCTATRTDTATKLGHDPIKNPSAPNDYIQESDKHYVKCSRQGCNDKADQGTSHSYKEDSNKCVCGKDNPNQTVETTAIKLNATAQSIAVGGKCTLTATIEPNNATNKSVTWKSSDTAVATVENGEVTGIKGGTAEITAEQGNLSAKCTITVTDAKPVYTVEITGGSSVIKGKTLQLTATVKDKDGKQVTPTTITWSSDKPTTVSVPTNNSGSPITVSGEEVGSATITAKCTVDGTEYTGTQNVSVTNPFQIKTNDSTTLTSWDRTIELVPYFDGNECKTDSVTWSQSASLYFDYNKGTNNRIVVAPKAASKDTQTATFTATANIDGKNYTASIQLSLKFSAEINLTASVSDDYYFGDVSDKGSYSVEDQLLRAIPNNHELYYVTFSNVVTNYGDLDNVTRNEKIYAEDIEDILFIPEKKGDAVFNFTAYTYTKSTSQLTEREGILTITVTDASDSSGDVVFYGEVGEDIAFDSASFEDFWNDKYSKGDLEYVKFSVTGGILYDGDGKKVGTKECHVSPRKTEIALDEVYFEPNSANKKKATTITFSFTAYGEDNSGKDKDLSGRVSIVYVSESPKDITYSVGSSGTVSLKGSDFSAAYKEVISGSVPSNLTIVFQGVPKNGTLTYTDSSKKNAKDVKLTSSNIKKYSFTTKSSGTNQLNDIVYAGTSGTDTIEYTAYSGSTIKFKGKVVFNGTAAVPTDVVVTYGSTGGQAVRFSQNDFVSANSAMSKATKVRFVAPANGTLLMNGASASGVDIATTLLGTVTYQPKSGFNGQDKIIFAAYDASNNTVASGTVNITVIGNPTTGTTPGGTPGGVSDVSQFKDVSATAWYRDNLATLVRKGIITGKGDGKFDPLGTVTYGEALKMVLESCGYTAALGTGSNWAINYKNLAVSRGWISSDIDLNAAISRNATAELTAKVLGVSAVTSGSPFADEANGYAAALYYTSPQIFAGSPNPNGGKPLFKNSSPLLRQEVCAVICRVSDYHTQHTTNNMPDGI